MGSEIEFKDKLQGLTLLKEEFKLWEKLLSQISEKDIVNPINKSKRTIKDNISHLWDWQRISIARMIAALSEEEPDLNWFPKKISDPDSDSNLEEINKWMYETNRNKTWTEVFKDWKKGFTQFIDLTEKISENNLFSTDKYPWLKGYPLIAVPQGTYDHHEEHLTKLLEHLKQNLSYEVNIIRGN